MFDEIHKGKWWDKPWSLITGCKEVSEGCDGCWERDTTERLANRILFLDRYKGLLTPDGKWTGQVRMNEGLINDPKPTQKPAVWSIWTDLFHPGVTKEFQLAVFKRMAECTNHLFVVCTKRIKRACSSILEIKIRSFADVEDSVTESFYDYMQNIIIMTTAETQALYDYRLPWLLRTPLKHRALSLEPLLEPITLRLDESLSRFDTTMAHVDQRIVADKLSWVITGGETGNCHYDNARVSNPLWFKFVQLQCEIHNIPYLHKHNGEWATITDNETSIRTKVGKIKAGRLLFGELFNGTPTSAIHAIKIPTKSKGV